MAAKPRLASFSIETDQEVLVKFDDGSCRRLKKSELRDQLHADDYARIRKAFRLRQSFWRRNLPGSLAVVLAGAASVAALLVTADRPLFHLVTPHHVPGPTPVSDFTAAHTIPTPTPAPSGTPASSVQPGPAQPPTVHHGRKPHPGLLRQLSGLIGRVLQ